MPTLVVPANVPPCQVDDFPTKVEEIEQVEGKEKRTVRKFERGTRTKGRGKGAKSVQIVGALYIRPASTLQVSDDELRHLKEKHPALLGKLIVHAPGRSLAALSEVAAAKAKATDAETLPSDSVVAEAALDFDVPPPKPSKPKRGTRASNK